MPNPGAPNGTAPDFLCPEIYRRYEGSLLCAATLTLLCLTVQLALFCRHVRFRSHASRLVLFRSAHDALFALISVLNTDTLSGEGWCTGDTGMLVAFLTEVSHVGAEMCFLIIAIDPVVSIVRPFLSGARLRCVYYAFVATCSTVTGIVFWALLGPSEGHTDSSIGLSSYGICWIKNPDTHVADPADQKINAYNVGFIYTPVCVGFVVALFSQAFVWRSVSVGLPRTLMTRMRVLRRQSVFVGVFLVYYAVVAGLLWTNYTTRLCWDSTPTRLQLFLWLIGGRGIVTLALWMYTFNTKTVLCCAHDNHSRRRAGDTKPLEDEADAAISARLNTALRQELLYYTTLGMRVSARAQERLRTTAVHRTKHTFYMPRKNWHASALRPKNFVSQMSSMETGTADDGVDDDGDGNDDNDDDRGRRRSGHALSFSAAAVLGLSSDVRLTETQSPEEIASRELERRSSLRAGGDRHAAAASIQQGELDGVALLHQTEPGSFRLMEGRREAEDGAGGTALGASSVGGRWTRALGPGTVPFHDFFPARFEDIRISVGIPTEEYVTSLRKTTKERFSDGASGAFLFFSHDRKYIIKSMTSAEREVLLEMLPAYHAHVKNHPESLLTRFLGCHSVSLSYTGELSFVVMENMFAGSNKLHETYDLKGSWVSRHGALREGKTQAECQFCDKWFRVSKSGRGEGRCSVRPNGQHYPKCVRKDLDVNWRFEVGEREAGRLSAVLCADANFLCHMGIMDYSLIVGVEKTKITLAAKHAANAAAAATNAAESSPLSAAASKARRPDKLSQFYGQDPTALRKPMTGGDGSGNTYLAAYCTAPNRYTFGVIDMLQAFTWEKKMERLWKVYGPAQLDGDGISCIEPKAYCERFKRRVVKAFIAPPRKSPRVSLSSERSSCSDGGVATKAHRGPTPELSASLLGDDALRFPGRGSTRGGGGRGGDASYGILGRELSVGPSVDAQFPELM